MILKIIGTKITRDIAWWAMILSAVSYMIFRTGNYSFLSIYLVSLGIMDVSILLYFFFHIRQNNYLIHYPNLFIFIVLGLLFWYLIQSKFASYQWIIDSISWQLAMLIGYFDVSEGKSTVSRFKVNTALLMMTPFCIQLILMRLAGLDVDGSIIYGVYYILFIIPFILEEKPTIYRNVFLLMAIGLVLATSKRTGTLSMLLGLGVYVFVKNLYIERKNKKIFLLKILKVVAFLAIALIVINHFLSYFDIPLLERLSEMTTDSSANGRTLIWESVSLAIQQSDWSHKLMGYGYHATQSNLNLQGRGILAHNDFLEIRYDYGYIGLFLIVALLLIMAWAFVKMFKNKNSLLPVYIYLIIVIVSLMLVSYVFVQSTISVFAAWYIGKIIYLAKKETVRRNI